jgi:hypothetical protein
VDTTVRTHDGREQAPWQLISHNGPAQQVKDNAAKVAKAKAARAGDDDGGPSAAQPSKWSDYTVGVLTTRWVCCAGWWEPRSLAQPCESGSALRSVCVYTAHGRELSVTMAVAF